MSPSVLDYVYGEGNNTQQGAQTMSETKTIPSSKSGLKKLSISDLRAIATDMEIPVQDLSKTDLVDAIRAKQIADGSGSEEETETPETKETPAEEKAAEPVAEVELAIPETPASLTVLPTWIYFIAGSGESSTNVKRAYGAACRAVGRAPTVQDFERFRGELKDKGTSTVIFMEEEDEEAKATTVYRSRAI